MNGQKERVLVVAAHPDDELLGCGGTLIKHVEVGDEVMALVLCESESLRYAEGQVDMRTQFLRAMREAGIGEYECLGLPDQKLDQEPFLRIVTKLERVVCQFNPTKVFLHYEGDLNRDHRIAREAALVALRPRGHTLTLLEFYTPSSTEFGAPVTFQPNVWVDIGSTVDRKLNALSYYRSEMMSAPHPRSLENVHTMAKFFGMQVRVHYAEAFRLIRQVVL